MVVQNESGSSKWTENDSSNLSVLKSELKSYRAKQLKKVYKTHEYE